MPGGPKKTGQLQQTGFKAVLQVRVSDPEIPDSPDKESLRIDVGDIRPKLINWDLSVPSPTIPANAANGDWLIITAAGAYNSVSYGVDDKLLVINKLTNTFHRFPALTGGTTISGAVWLKSIAKGTGSSPTSALSVSNQGNYAVKGITGDETNLALTIGAIPGTTGDTTVAVYSVAGAFTPTQAVPYPSGTPASATFGTIRGNTSEVDNLEFTAELTVTFSGGLAQIVILHSSGAYQVIPYSQVSLPTLTAVNITSSYPVGHDGFTSGDTVNFSFTASAAITQIAFWPFDSVLASGVPTGTPVVATVSGSSGTGSFTIPAAIAGGNAYVASGKVYAAVKVGAQYSAAIQTTSNFLFDNRTPVIGGVSINYPGSQTAIKASEVADVSYTGLQFTSTISVNFAGTDQLAPVSPGSVPYTVSGATLNTTVGRGVTGYNGPANVTATATNSNNGKTATSNFTVHVQDTSFDAPTVTVNGGSKVSTAVGGKAVTLAIASEVRLKNPTGLVTVAGASVGSFSTANNGYTWTATITVADNATRGSNAVADTGVVTGADSAVVVSGSYIVSGFDERVIYFDGVGSPYMTLGDPTSDYPAGLVVKDIANVVLSDEIYSYDEDNNRLVFTDYYDDNTGSLFAYVSQIAYVSQPPPTA